MLTKTLYVPPSGDPYSPIVVCGEQPGQMEVRAGKPFVGPAGRALDECLLMAGIPRHEVYFTNVIKDLDKPLASYINITSKGKSTVSKEGLAYIQELGEELQKLKDLGKLNVVVTTGNTPLLALTSRVGITKWRASVLESTLVSGLKVVPTFHPATFIPPKFNFLNKPLIVEDLKLAKHESNFPELIRTERKTIIRPSFQQSMQYLDACYEFGRRGRIIDCDIEVINGELDCISFSYQPTEAISIPFRDHQGNYFSPPQEVEIMLGIAKILQSERVAKRGANFIFDTQFLFRKYGIEPRGDIHCTQIAQKIGYPDYNAGLDFVTSMWTDIPYYKADGKKWIKMGTGSDWDTWWQYNGMDSMATGDAHPKQILDLKNMDNFETYERQRKLIKPLLYMGERGIRVDVSGMVDFKAHEEAKLELLAEELHEVTGNKYLNYNSPQQLMAYFYGVKDEDTGVYKGGCGIKPYKKKNNKNQWVVTTDVDALKRIARLGVEGSKAARVMLDIRSLSKRISTYLDIGKVDDDGRYRSSYKPVGAATGRLASGETIFGKGGNQQNWPHDLLRYFLFDEGYIGYSLDLSQIENRIVAYVGGVVEQIRAFEEGIDLHRLTASIIFGKPYDEISGEDGSSSLGDGRQSERYWGKKGNHATNYDVQYRTFALKNEMREMVAKHTLETIHSGYPQIRQGYHVTIQNMLKKNRIVTNLLGRKRMFFGPIVPTPIIPKGACVNTYREAYAQLPQSTVADKINEYGIEYIYENQDIFRPVELLAQVHDSVVFQIPLTVPWIEHARTILRVKNNLERPLYWRGTEIPTPCDVAVGLNMCKEDMVEFKSAAVPGDPYKLADMLEGVHRELCKRTAEISVTG